MLVERALKKVFSCLSINNRDVQFNYGTQRELNQWIANRNQTQAPKFPLIWFISNDYKKDKDRYIVDQARIIVFMNTKYEWLNDKRDEETYRKYIEPLTRLVVDKLTNTMHLDVYGKLEQDKFKYRDVRNYGVSLDEKIDNTTNSFSSTSKKSEKSIITDFVDATFIDFAFEIKPKCII